MSAPVFVLNQNTKREHGRKTQLTNIKVAKAVADVIQTTLGPRSMLKMLLDPMGGIVLSNDGHAILREVEVKHPAAKSMLEISRAQDEEVGDGTTSVIVLAGEMMISAQPFIIRELHPTIIVKGYYRALHDGLKVLKEIAEPLNFDDNEAVQKALFCCIGTKFAARWKYLVVDLAIHATRVVLRGSNPQKLTLDVKRYAKVEKIPGGALDDSEVLDGVMFNKDLVHPKMRREIRNPRVILLDSPLEYKKGESQTSMEMNKESDMTDALQQEMNEVAYMCQQIIKWKPDVVITEKGVSDYATHHLQKHDISVIRRIRKTDNQRIARVTGAQIVNRPDEIQESDIGREAGLFRVGKIGDEYFTYFLECQNPKACTILLRGGSKDVLNEIERNLQDALAVAKNLAVNPQLVPGGGATEMELSHRLNEIAKTVEGQEQMPYRALAYSLEIIPRTLAQNCGADIVRVMTELRAKHATADGRLWGINGITGKLQKMDEIDIWEPLSVKTQIFQSAVEASSMLLRIDDVVSGFKKPQEPKKQKGDGAQDDPQETFGDARDG